MPRPTDRDPSAPAGAVRGRRTILATLATGAAATAVAPAVLPGRLLAAAGAQASTDRSFAATAEGLERVLVAVYEAVVPTLPDDVAPIAETYLAHHREHADAFAELAGAAATGEPDPALVEALGPTLDGLSGVGPSLRLARELEQRAVATYVAAMGQLADAETIAVVASVAPVDAAHAATWSDVLDEGLDAGFPAGASEPTDPSAGLQAFTVPGE